jgi:hypothetical protein
MVDSRFVNKCLRTRRLPVSGVVICFDDVWIPFLPDLLSGADFHSGGRVELEQYRYLLPGSLIGEGLPRDLSHFPHQGELLFGNGPRSDSAATEGKKRKEKNRKKRTQRKEKTFQADLESLIGAFRPTLKVYCFEYTDWLQADLESLMGAFRPTLKVYCFEYSYTDWLRFYHQGEKKSVSWGHVDCLLRAIQLYSRNASDWYNLGVEGGGGPFTERDCYINALELDGAYYDAWINLGITLGNSGVAVVSCINYTQQDCYLNYICSKKERSDCRTANDAIIADTELPPGLFDHRRVQSVEAARCYRIQSIEAVRRQSEERRRLWDMLLTTAGDAVSCHSVRQRCPRKTSEAKRITFVCPKVFSVIPECFQCVRFVLFCCDRSRTCDAFF